MENLIIIVIGSRIISISIYIYVVVVRDLLLNSLQKRTADDFWRQYWRRSLVDEKRGGKECVLFLVMGGVVFRKEGVFPRFLDSWKYGGWWERKHWRVKLLQLAGGSGNIRVRLAAELIT